MAQIRTLEVSEERVTGSPAEARVAPKPGRGSRKLIILGVVGILALTLIGAGVRRYLFGRTHVTTDNAQIEGHITPVLARSGGFVAEVRVGDNQQVQAGDTVVILDDRELVARLAQAEAELAALLTSVGSNGNVGRAQAQASAVRASASAADAQVEQARANSQRANADLQRIASLAERNIVSQQQLDASRAAADAATAQLRAAERNAIAAREQIGVAIGVAQADVGSADARVLAARAARDQVALQLSYTRIVVPTTGVVSRNSVEVGQLVQAGQPLMSVVPVSDVWVLANLKETDIDRVHAGEDVEFTVDAYPGSTFHGIVESISPATGAKFSLLPPDNATGNFTKVIQRVPVRIRVDGELEPNRPLRPGMSAEVVIATG
jgi:membrane fusion protein, multidrug efflux system